MAINDLLGKGRLSNNKLKRDSIGSRAKILQEGCQIAINNLSKVNDDEWLKRNKSSWVRKDGDGYKLTLRWKNKVIDIVEGKDAVQFDNIDDVEDALHNIKDALKEEPYEGMKWCLENIEKKGKGAKK